MLQLYQQYDDEEIGVLLQLYQQYDDEEIGVLCYSCISSMMMKRSVCYVTVVSAV